MDKVKKYLNKWWQIRYSEYVDELILFSPDFYSTDRDSVEYRWEGNDIMYGIVDTRMVYLKIEGASRYFGNGIESRSIEQIINQIKEFTYA